ALVDVPVGGRADPVPAQRKVDLAVAGPYERDRVAVQVADRLRARYLLVAVEHGGQRATVQERVEVDRMGRRAQLATDRATGELTGVDVGVEAARVGLDRVEQARLGDGHRTDGRVERAGQRGTEQRNLDRAVGAGRALVDVAGGRRRDALPPHRERDLVAL